MQNSFHQYSTLLTWLGIISTATFFLSLVAVPLLLCKLDKTFFIHLHQQGAGVNRHPVLRVTLRGIRYVLGTFLLIIGFLMLFLPGQGLLTMILGISLLDFPGKKRVIDKILTFPSIPRALNWIREKGNKQPFLFPDTTH